MRRVLLWIASVYWVMFGASARFARSPICPFLNLAQALPEDLQVYSRLPFPEK
jgi:hypothetical protein